MLGSAQGGPYERQKVDPAAATRGRAVYAQHCINCHGSTAKGTERGPDLIRSPRGAARPARERHRSGHRGSRRRTRRELTDAQVVDLSHFLHQRIEAIATNRNARAPINVLTGDPEAGRAYFNGAGGAARAIRRPATWPASRADSRPGQPAAAVPVPQPPTRRPEAGRGDRDDGRRADGVAGALVRIDDFSVSLRDASGEFTAFSRGPGVTVHGSRSARGASRAARSLHRCRHAQPRRPTWRR